jgi:hypothetical protein
MTENEPETAKWISDHRCTYEIQPVVEIAKGTAGQVGFELSLHAELPVGEALTPELAKEVDEIRDRLGDVLESLIPTDAKARIERVPFRRAFRFMHGSAKNPMVTRTLRVFHPDYSALRPDDRKKLAPTEKRLTEMGFRKA